MAVLLHRTRAVNAAHCGFTISVHSSIMCDWLQLNLIRTIHLDFSYINGLVPAMFPVKNVQGI